MYSIITLGKGKLMGLASCKDKDWVNTQPMISNIDSDGYPIMHNFVGYHDTTHA